MGVRHLIDPRRALLRVASAIVSGVTAGLAARSQGLHLAGLIGWNAAGATLLILAWVLIFSADEKVTADRAGSEDPGRTLVYGIVLIASSVSLLAALIVTRNIASVPPGEAAVDELMCLVTVALAWGLTHTAFTLRYAHLYYRDDDEGVGGVEFPGKCTPSYLDFAYFAFTIGMCFQTSDVCITSTQLRRAVLFQAIISFGYNTAIIAFVLNLVFSKVT